MFNLRIKDALRKGKVHFIKSIEIKFSTNQKILSSYTRYNR